METKLSYQIPNVVSLGGTSAKIPVSATNFCRIYNSKQVPTEWVDGDTATFPPQDWSSVIADNDKRTWYEFKGFDNVVIDRVRIFDFVSTVETTPLNIYAIDRFWQRTLVATFLGQSYNAWIEFTFDPVEAKYLLFTGPVAGVGNYSTEFEVWGTYTDLNPPAPSIQSSSIFDNLCGSNTYEWNLFQGGGTVPARTIDANKRTILQNLRTVRHYLDWSRIEGVQRSYRYQPQGSGSWYTDDFYQAFNDDNIEVLLCLQGIPSWMENTWPVGERDHENRPQIYGKNPTDVYSYIEQAQMGFQLAARYGSNTSINPDLVLVDTTPRWEGDVPNEKKIGLGTIRWIECANENNRGWKGRKGYSTGREHAANLSAFYDGHKGTMGDDVGVKTADPTIMVTTCGTVGIDVKYFQAIIDWSIEHRGRNIDGTPDVPFDAINFHSYRNDGGSEQNMGVRTRGQAPEPSGYFESVMSLKNMIYEYFGNDMPVILGETGYDINQGSVQKAIPIGGKSAEETQADWLIRLVLESGAAGITFLYLYQLYDDDTSGNSTTQYMTSGIANVAVYPPTRRPSLTYIKQALSFMSTAVYAERISTTPRVDRWEIGSDSVYAVWSPTENGSTGSYELTPVSHTAATLYEFADNSDTPDNTVLTPASSYSVDYSETPVFIKVS